MKTVCENEIVWVKPDLNASLRKTAYKAGLVSHNLDFWRVPPLADKSGSLCLNCTQNMVYAKYLLSFLVQNFSTCQREAAYVTGLQYKPKALSL